MKCPRCQQENPSHAKLCLECGAPFKRTSESAPPQASYTDTDLQRALSESLEPRFVPARRHVRRQDSQRRQARRPSCRATDEIRAGRQPQDRQSSRPYYPALAAGAGGSDHSVKRKDAKSQQRRARAQDTDATVSILPMEIQIGDRFTNHDFEWEVLTHPAALHGGKSLRARIQRPGLPETERDMTWPAHVRVDIRRGSRRTE
jgi:hypothetical protein